MKSSGKVGRQRKTSDKSCKCKKLLSEYRDVAQRVQADFENYKKRVVKENELVSRSFKVSFIRKCLPVLDSFDLSIDSIDNPDLKKGFELIYSQFFGVLSSEGLSKIDALGKVFDPFFHEVLLEGDGEAGVVLEELQAGYVVNGDVVRPSKVKVGRIKK